MNTLIGKLACWLTPAALAFGTTGMVNTAALAQDKPAGYPVRPIRIIIAVAPGGGVDFIARATAQMLRDRWGQNAVVDSRPGGAGVIAAELAAKAAPDGYTLFQYGDGMALLGATKRVRFDVRTAFDPIVGLSAQPYIILVHHNVAARSIKELVALSAAKPLTYSGGGGVGAAVHLGMERLASLSGMKLKYISYKGAAPSILALMGGEINMVAASAMASIAAIRSGNARGVAATGLTRIAVLPDLPTVAEQGVPGYKLTNRYNLWAPAGTPRAIIAALNRVVSDGMHAPQMVQRLAAEGTEPAERMTPEEFKALIAREYVEVERSVQQLGIKH
jgi:tripartite-type tricarboxylate transporter receptor subunit TctC